MAKAPRSDKGKFRSIWVVYPCDGCGKDVWRRKKAMRPTMWCSRECYRTNGAKAAGFKGAQGGAKGRIAFLEERLEAYRARFGPPEP